METENTTVIAIVLYVSHAYTNCAWNDTFYRPKVRQESNTGRALLCECACVVYVWIKKMNSSNFDVTPYCRILESIACDSIVKVSMSIEMKCVRNSIRISVFLTSCIHSPFSRSLSLSLVRSPPWHT